MRFQINGYYFDQGEVEAISFTEQLATSERGDPLFTTRRLQVVVDQTITGVIPNSRRFETLRNLIIGDGVERVGFCDVNMAPTSIFIYGVSSMSGIRVINPPSWIPRTPVEMATHMSILMTFEADFEVNDASQIMAYEDQLIYEDEGDNRTVALETDTGPVEFFTTCLNPKRYLTQVGFCDARDAYPLPNSPLLAGLPIIQRVISRRTPRKLGKRYIGYGVAWRYVFIVPSYGNWFPQLR